MKIKQNHLLKIYLHLEYYKECITDRYGVMLTDFLVDNDVLDNLTKRLYITTLDKQIKMEQENQQVKKQKEVIDRILNETKETRNILNDNRDDNMLSKSCLLSYLEIVEDLLKEVTE